MPVDSSSSSATAPPLRTKRTPILSISTTSPPNGTSTIRERRWPRPSALHRAGIPVGKVYTSKYNRACETAALAGFSDVEKTTDLTEGGLVVSPRENNRRAEAFRKMLATAPQPGTNTILVTHQPNIIAALGKDWFDVKEGEALIFHPGNGGYAPVARVQMEEWPRLALAAKRP